MADYDFGTLASPAKKDTSYDFGTLATKKEADKPTETQSPALKAANAIANNSIYGGFAGAAEAGLNMATGMIAKPVSEIAGLAAVGKEMVSPTPGGGDPQGFQRELQDKMTYQPRLDVGKTAAKYNPVALVGKGIGAVADKAGDIVGGDPKTSSTLRQAAGNAVREGIEQGAGFIGAKGMPAARLGEAIPKNIKLSPEMTAVNKAAKNIGVELQPHQLTDNKYGKVAGAELAKVPLSGSKDAINKAKWNQALAKEIGGDAKDGMLTPNVYSRAKRQSGATIDRVTGRNKLKINDDFNAKIDEIRKELGKETSDNASVVNAFIDELYSKAQGNKPAPVSKILGPDGKPLAPSTKPVAPDIFVDGITFRKFNTGLGERIKKIKDNGDLRTALSDLQDNLLKAFNDGIENKADVAALKTARMQYAKAKDIAGIVGDPKGVNPTALRAQIRNTKFKKDLYAEGKSSFKDLADVGDLLRDPNSSMTAERNLLYKVGTISGAAGAAGALATGPTAASLAGLYGTANLYNRLGNRMLPTEIPQVPKGPRKPGYIDYAAVPRLPQNQNGDN